jgi:hypothetical protein
MKIQIIEDSLASPRSQLTSVLMTDVFRDGQRANVVLKAKVGDVGIISNWYIPHVGNEIGAEIYKKLNQTKTTLGDYSINQAGLKLNLLWFHSVGRYWLAAYNFPPYFSHAGKKGMALFSPNCSIPNSVGNSHSKPIIVI